MGSCLSTCSSHPEDSPQGHNDTTMQAIANRAPDNIDLINRSSSTAEVHQSPLPTPDNSNSVRASGAPIATNAGISTASLSTGPQFVAPAAEGLTAPRMFGEAPTDDFVTILPSNAEPSSTTPEDDMNLAALREYCPRFRILIIGKANAGKTTILQKMCNTTEAPIIRDQEGNVVDPSVISPTDGRGIHDIDHELTFSSNPNFVFHDSLGFEAGSTQELDNVRQFIAKRAAANSLKDQLHAIWYCLPTDNDRPLSKAEMSFFEQGTGRAPVVAIFTKYDGLILKEYNKLRFEKGYEKVEANKTAPIFADDFFRNSEFYLKRLQQTAHPPARYLRVQNLNNPKSSCADLSKLTLEALDNKKLQLLFVSVQQNNIELSTKFALQEYVLKELIKTEPRIIITKDVENMMLNALVCYRHLVYGHDYSFDEFGLDEMLREDELRLMDELRELLERRGRQELLSILRPARLSLVGKGSGTLQELEFSIEDSFQLVDKQQQSSTTAPLKLAWEKFEGQGRYHDIVKKVDEEFSGVNLEEFSGDREELQQKVEGIMKVFRVEE